MNTIHFVRKQANHPYRSILLLLVMLLSTLLAYAADSTLLLKKGDRVAVVGDSITEQKLYSKFIETYLTVCVPQLEIKSIQLGWSGERASGFAERMDNDLAPWKPTVVTTCYGMNDGMYKPYEEATGKVYEDNMRKIAGRLKELEVRAILGSPGVVDSTTFAGGNATADVYNECLGKLGELAKKTAEDNGMRFADVHAAMSSAMKQAKASLGDSYHVAGTDGVHPFPNGQLVMAYTFLRAMGLDGQIAVITVDWTGKPAASEGHKILSSDNGKLEIESTRYPFCFDSGEKDPGATGSILPFVPFQQDLNRFTLIVKNLPGKEAEVKWGNAKKVFASKDLASGINLAAEFVDENPFTGAFNTVLKAVAEKEAFETTMIKQFITQMRTLQDPFKEDPKLAKSADEFCASLWNYWEVQDEKVRATCNPVRHSIEIKPLP